MIQSLRVLNLHEIPHHHPPEEPTFENLHNRALRDPGAEGPPSTTRSSTMLMTSSPFFGLSWKVWKVGRFLCVVRVKQCSFSFGLGNYLFLTTRFLGLTRKPMVSASSFGLCTPEWVISNAPSEKPESKDPVTLPGSHCPLWVVLQNGSHRGWLRNEI